MKKPRRIFFLMSLLILILTIAGVNIYNEYWHGYYAHSLFNLAQTLGLYAKTIGEYPTCKEDLFTKGFVSERVMSDGRKIIYVRLPNENGIQQTDREEVRWSQCPAFNIFTINYGIDLRSLEVVDSRLVERADNTAIRLVDGPYSRRLSYDHYSLEVFKAFSEP